MLVNDLVRSRGKLLPFFFANIILTTLNVILINLLNFLYTVQDAFARNLDSVFLNYTLITEIFTFVIFIICVVFIFNIVSNVVFTLYYIEKRTKDIGIMKATGSNQTHVLQFFLFAPAIICMLSFGIASVTTSAVMTSIWPSYFPSTATQTTLVLILLAGNVASITLTPAFKIGQLFEKKVAENLAGHHSADYSELRKKSVFRSFLKRLGRTTLLSYKNLLTRKHDLSRSMAAITFACLASGLLFTSAFVIQATYSRDLKASLGGNDYQRVVVAGSETMIDFITDCYRGFYDASVNPEYLSTMHSNEHCINRSAFNMSRYSDIITRFDWRVVYKTTAREVQGVEPTPPTGYKVWGKARSCPVVLQGIEWNAAFNAPESLPLEPFGPDGRGVITGDSVAGLIIENPEFQKLDLDEVHHEIEGQLFEPFNNGFTVYMDPPQLWNVMNVTPFYNCMFLVMKPAHADTTASWLADLDGYMKATYGGNFSVKLLDTTFTAVIDSGNSIGWLYAGIASLIFMFSLIFQNEFIDMAIQSNAKDYKVMHALGMKRKSIARVLHDEFSIVLTIACTLAFGICLIFTSLFLIPAPALPPIYVPIAIFGAIWLCFFGSSKIMVSRGKKLRFLSEPIP